MFKFSKKSKSRLETCHPDIIQIMNVALSISNIDFGISEGHRSINKQKEYFDKGLSKKDGVTSLSKHNYYPSLAVDIYPYFNNQANWDKEHLSYLAGIIHAVSENLYSNKKIKHRIRWGGNWDMDGTIIKDQSFNDRPHFELL